MAIDRTQAPPAGKVQLSSFPRLFKETLSNGIPVIHLPFGREDLVEIQMVYRAGHSFENQSGLTQVTSRMMQEGNRSYDSLAFAEILDFYGASVDIESGFESTSFSLTTLTRHLDKTVDLLQEMLLHPSFPEKEFTQYRQRSLQQLSVEEKKTGYVARRNFSRLLFGSQHPYGRMTGREELTAIQHDQLRACYHTFFRPGPAVILCSGKYETDTLLDVLNGAFGKMTYLPTQQASLAAGTLFPTETGIHHFPVADSLQSTIRAGVPSISRNHADYYPLLMTSIILGGYFGSRLMKNIREEKGYTYGIGCSLNALRHSGSFSIGTDVGHDFVEPCIREIHLEIERMREEPVSFEELETARNYFLGLVLSRRETLFQLGETLKNAWVNDLDLADFDRAFREMKDLTPADIQNYSRKYLNPSEFVWVIAGKNA